MTLTAWIIYTVFFCAPAAGIGYCAGTLQKDYQDAKDRAI